MTAERRMLMTEAWGLKDLVLASAEEAIEGYIACFDVASGFVVAGKSALGLLPIGTFKRYLLGDGVQKVQVQFFEELHANWFNNDSTTPVATTDRGKPCYLKDGQTVSMDPTARSTAGRVLAVSVSGGQVLIHAGIAMSGPSDADTDVSAIAAAAAVAAAAAAAAQTTANAAQLVTTSLTTTGTAPAFVLTPSPAPGAYAAGNRYSVVFHAASKRLSTLNVSGLGPKKLKRYDNLGSKNGGFYAVAGIRTDIIYDGTDWVVIDQRPDYALRAVQPSSARSWSSRVTPTLNGWNRVCWSPELHLFVAVTTSGTGNRAMSSPDGIAWTIRASAADNYWIDLVWAAEIGLFVAVALFGTAGTLVMTSPDGITWTSRVNASGAQWNGLCWSSELGLLVAVSYGSADVMTSPDGINWTLRVGISRNWNSVCWAAELGLLVAVGQSGTGDRVMTSPDGINWTSRASAADSAWITVCWAPEPGLFVALGSLGVVMTSPDGITWSLRTGVGSSSWSQVIWISELGIFVGVAFSVAGGARVMTSLDGIAWTGQLVAADQRWKSICWSPELSLICAVSDAGTGRDAMTSRFAAETQYDPPRSFGVALLPVAAGMLLVDATAYWFYCGYTPLETLVNFVRFAVATAGVGAQTAEVAVATSPLAPNRAAQVLTILAATGVLGALTGTGVLGNTTELAALVGAGKHWWVGIRTHMAVTQPTLDAVSGDFSQGRILATAGSAALVAGATPSGALIAHALTAQAPALLATSD